MELRSELIQMRRKIMMMRMRSNTQDHPPKEKKLMILSCVRIKYSTELFIKVLLTH